MLNYLAINRSYHGIIVEPDHYELLQCHQPIFILLVDSDFVVQVRQEDVLLAVLIICLLYTSPSPRD